MLDWLVNLVGASEVIKTAAQYVLVALGATLAAKGYVDGGAWNAALPALIAACAGLWGTFKSTPAAMIKRAARLPSVSHVVHRVGTKTLVTTATKTTTLRPEGHSISS